MKVNFIKYKYIFAEKIDFEELYDEQLIYKRTPMDFIDHLWELLSRIHT